MIDIGEAATTETMSEALLAPDKTMQIRMALDWIGQRSLSLCHQDANRIFRPVDFPVE